MQTRSRLQRIAVRVIFDDYLDLYLLAATALAVAILGAVGVADIKVLAATILALLAVLAFAQIRSRQNVSEIVKLQTPDPLAVFRMEFPAELSSRRASASSLLLIGLSMSRTVRGISHGDLLSILSHGGTIRVLLLDPENEQLVWAASQYRAYGMTPDGLKKRIQGSLDELKDMSENNGGTLEVRVTKFIPHMSINAIDVDRKSGFIVVQHYEYMPVTESAPIFFLKPSDTVWFNRFAAEAQRMWEAGIPWPGSPPEFAETPEAINTN